MSLDNEPTDCQPQTHAGVFGREKTDDEQRDRYGDVETEKPTEGGKRIAPGSEQSAFGLGYARALKLFGTSEIDPMSLCRTMVAPSRRKLTVPFLPSK